MLSLRFLVRIQMETTFSLMHLLCGEHKLAPDFISEKIVLICCFNLEEIIELIVNTICLMYCLGYEKTKVPSIRARAAPLSEEARSSDFLLYH